MFEPGTVIADKYRVEHLLGQGGMGVVVAAEHVELRTRVALKFLAEHHARHAEVVERFLREARACARLRSEHVCRVSDVGRTDTGVPFLVMELLEGFDLARMLVERGPIDAATAATYMIQACDALVEAHTDGIVHRDLKPANLFLVRHNGPRPLIKVLDFGIAKAQDDQDASITRTGAIMGSPSYMAPEQLRSARYADARSDIWSLGVALVELTTGEKPYDGESTIDLALNIVNHPPRYPASMDPALVTVVDRCLRKDANERFQTAAELRVALEPIAANLAGAPPRAFGPSSVLVQSPYAVTTLGSASGVVHARRPTRRVVVVVASAIALAGGLAVFAITRSGAGGDEPAQSAVPSAPAPVVVEPADAAVVPVPTPDPNPIPTPDRTSTPPAPAPVVPKHPLRHRPKTKDEIGESRT